MTANPAGPVRLQHTLVAQTGSEADKRASATKGLRTPGARAVSLA